MRSNFPESRTCECHTDTVGDAIMQDHEYGYMQFESNHAPNCKLGKKRNISVALQLESKLGR